MPKLVIKLSEMKEFSFDKPLIRVGRSLDNDVVIDNLSVSRNHSQIELVNGTYFVMDLSSANGTFVNGVKIQKQALKDQDEIIFGKVKVYFLEDLLTQTQTQSISPFDFDKTVVLPKIEPCYLQSESNPNQVYKFEKLEATIGRESDCDVVVGDWLAAKKHVRICYLNNRYILKDMGTMAGTKVNGQKVKEANLEHNDIIEIGFTKFRFLKYLDKVPASMSGHDAGIHNLESFRDIKSVHSQNSDKLNDAPFVSSMAAVTFHHKDCKWVNGIQPEKRVYYLKAEDAIMSRHRSCGTCKPGRTQKQIKAWEKLINDSDETLSEHAKNIINLIEGHSDGGSAE